MQMPIRILWDNKAKSDLKLLFDFIKIKSLHGANNVVQDIVNQTKGIHFAEQYQVDELLGEPFRRIIVRDFKIIYKVQNETEIRILQIFDTRQNPNKLNK
jgi:plasmid stabilization system protein ParE